MIKRLVLIVALGLIVSPVTSFAQDEGNGIGSQPVGPASQNGNTSAGETKVPGSISGRSASPSKSTDDANPPAISRSAGDRER
jgi:hypothetical protein